MSGHNLSDEDRNTVIMLRALALNIVHGYITTESRGILDKTETSTTLTWTYTGTPLSPEKIIVEALNRS